MSEWIPAADDVADTLAEGAHVADVGCGRPLITLLEAYPDVTAVGYDLSIAQLEGRAATPSTPASPTACALSSATPPTASTSASR